MRLRWHVFSSVVSQPQTLLRPPLIDIDILRHKEFRSGRSSPCATPAQARIGGRSATDNGHQIRRVAVALNLNLARDALDLGEVLGG